MFNRKDCCGERLANAEVFIGSRPIRDGDFDVDEDDDDNINPDWQKCGRVPDDTRELYRIDVQCEKPLDGSYVVVRLPGRGVLTLCEVQVYATGDNEGLQI